MISVVFLIIGGFGNTISIIIFNNKEFKTEPTTTYLMCSCVFNIITIIYLPIMITPSLWVVDTINCKIYGGLVVWIVEVQAWIVALCSFDRLITVLYPHKFMFKNKLRFQLGSIITIVIVILVLICPFMYFYNAELNVRNQTVCSFPNEPTWILVYFKFQLILFRTLLPFAIMIISSVTIVYKLCKMKAKFYRNSVFKREIQLAKSLVAMDIFFIIFRLPTMFYVIFNNNDNRLVYSFIYSIFVSLGTINNVFIFIIFIEFNKVYRDIFIKYMKYPCNKIRMYFGICADKT